MQDNQSTTLLAKNGTFSSSKKTKHIKHKFYLIKYKIAQGDVEVQYEPTFTMWCNILTKPKQGDIFQKFWEYLMNIPEDYNDEVEHLETNPLLITNKTSKELS